MPSGDAPKAGLTIRTLGPLQIERDGQPVPAPASKKARAILGYLILSPRPVGRQRLCDMFFDIPDDPRASLRWNLTKLRTVVDDAGAPRIISSGESLRFDPAGASVDILEVLKGERALQEADGLFLEDAELPDRQDFMAWLYAAREDLRMASVQRLRALLESPTPADRKLTLYRQLVFLEPLDESANIGVVRSLAQLGRMDDAREAAAGAERALLRAGMRPGAALRNALRAEAPATPIAEAPSSSPPIRASASSQLFDQLPGVAIIPFHNYSPDLISESLVDGFLESIIHMLSRFRQFRVSSMDTVLTFKGRMQDPEALRAATGADYIAGGSMMARGSAVKVRYRIVDATNGALLSSGDIDGAATSGAMIEEIPETLVSHLAHQVFELARHRAGAIPEDKRNATEHYLCGMSHGFLNPPLNYTKALECFTKALALAPDFPSAMAGTTWAKALTGQFYSEPMRSEAIALANKAIARGNDDAVVLSLSAWSLVQFGGDVNSALRAVDLAMRMNPLARSAWNISAWIRGMMGGHETAMRHWERAEKCSPLGASTEQINSGRALSCWLAGKYDEARDWARRGLERGPNNPAALTVALATAAIQGDRNTAREAAKQMLEFYPGGVDHPAIRAVPFVDPKERERILEFVRQGLAET